jgi:hypothetical protein
VRRTWREGSLTGDPEVYVKAGSGNGYISLHRALLGDHKEDTALPGTLREKWDFVLSGDLVYWGIRAIYKRRPWKRAALSIGAPLENLDAGSFCRGL